MAETKISMLKDEKITFVGVFDLKKTYRHIYNWLTWKGYDVEEKKFKVKNKATGQDYDIRWTATREIDEYSQFEIKLKWECFGVNKIEVQKNGAKDKADKGEVNLYVTASVVLDWQGRWEEKAIYLKFLKAFYEKYLYYGTIVELKKRIWNEGWECFNEAKAYLNLFKFS